MATGMPGHGSQFLEGTAGTKIVSIPNFCTHVLIQCVSLYVHQINIYLYVLV